MPSGPDFEPTGDCIVCYFVSNYLLQGLRVAVNMMWELFRGKCGNSQKSAHPLLLQTWILAPPMGAFSGDYGMSIVSGGCGIFRAIKRMRIQLNQALSPPPQAWETRLCTASDIQS